MLPKGTKVILNIREFSGSISEFGIKNSLL